MNIILTGFQGSGKTTAGYCLAKMAGLPFYDTDYILQQLHEPFEACIGNLHALLGEKRFREKEVEVLTNLMGANPGVIALGGGTLVHPDARIIASGLGKIVYLKVSYAVLEKRLRARIARMGCPTYLNPIDPFGSFKKIFIHREPIFLSLAQATIAVDALHQEQIAEKLWSVCA